MAKLFSVITLTYKKFTHLKETILSVCAQDYSDIEYIICDDGSDFFPEEQIVEWIEQNKKPNLKQYKIIKQKHNVGTVKNINFAYRQATGDYFLNLSCGDVFFEKNTVSKLAERIQKNDSKMLVTSRLLYIDEFKPIGILPHYSEYSVFCNMKTKEEQYKSFIMSTMYNMASGSVMCSSREVIEELNYFDESYIFWEDGPFLAKYLQNYKLDCWPELVSIWYEHGGISTGGMKKEYPLLRKDILLYNRTERIEHLEMLNNFEKKRIQYDNKCQASSSTIQRYLCYASYPVQTLLVINEKLMAKKYRKEDRKYIDQLLSKRTEPAVEYC